ncbi:MAG TPA: MarR family transcriptional regulator [Desulfosporosinus sp.]|nr:MarR family transcriptional regulator [Desulfosporosinus sp.]
MNEKDEENYDLTEQFTRIEWLLHRYHQQNHMHYGPMGDPRRGQGRVLAVLKMQPEISQKDLLFLLDMRPQSLGELLSKLEKNGYITRTLSETDRRVMNIKLTKEGTEATEQEFSFDKLFECLSEEEQMNLSIYLNRIIETIEAQLGDEQPGPDFDPRKRGGNPFDDRFGGHAGARGFHGRDFDPRGGMQDGQFDPRSEMGHRPGMMPFGRRPGMNRGHGECPAPSQKKSDED